MNINNDFNYQNILKSEFENRLAKNTQYSMRAFARDLNVTPQMLSAVLNNKKDLSVDSAVSIANRLGLTPEKTQDFLDAIVLSSCKTELAKNLIIKRIEDRHQVQDGYKPLTHEMFRAIADWYHLAILELATTSDFKSEPRWIASRLGITVFEVKEAITRLIKLELLDDENGHLKRTEFNVSALSDIPASALREHGKQILTKAIVALDEQTQDERDITSITMSIDPQRIPEAKKMILQFRRKLCKFLEQGDRKEVYVFSPVLFKLSLKKGKNS